MNHFTTDDRYFAKYYTKYGVIPTDEELPYMTQSIVHDFGALTTQITMYRFYPLTEED